VEDQTAHLEKSGAKFLPPASRRDIELANSALQQIRASVLPSALAEFYLNYGGALLGDSCVFPIEETERPHRRYTMPNLVGINRSLAGLAGLRGKSVWGQNMFYWFSADIGGNLYMHDVLTLQILKSYADAGAAISDCLLVGKMQ
jgi:hypothetical protein